MQYQKIRRLALRPVYSNTTQLNSTRRRVELCRYKRAFSDFDNLQTQDGIVTLARLWNVLNFN